MQKSGDYLLLSIGNKIKREKITNNYDKIFLKSTF